MQVAVEGVEQLENYFWFLFTSIFLCYAGTFDIVYLPMFYQCVISSSAACLSVPFIPIAIAAVQTWAKKIIEQILGAIYCVGVIHFLKICKV